MSNAAEQRKQIAADRARLKPTKVRSHHVPNWFRWRMMRAFGTANGSTNGYSVLEHALQTITGHGAIYGYWLDHWGSSLIEGQVCFVSEPYHLSDDDLRVIDTLAKQTDCHWWTSTNSWWYPGRTIRVAFAPELSPLQ